MFGKKGTVGATTAIEFFSSSFLEGFLHAAPSSSNSFHLHAWKTMSTRTISQTQFVLKSPQQQHVTIILRNLRLRGLLFATGEFGVSSTPLLDGLRTTEKGMFPGQTTNAAGARCNLSEMKFTPSPGIESSLRFFIPEQVNHVFNLGTFYRYCVSSLQKLFYYCKFSTMRWLLSKSPKNRLDEPSKTAVIFAPSSLTFWATSYNAIHKGNGTPAVFHSTGRKPLCSGDFEDNFEDKTNYARHSKKQWHWHICVILDLFSLFGNSRFSVLCFALYFPCVATRFPAKKNRLEK